MRATSVKWNSSLIGEIERSAACARIIELRASSHSATYAGPGLNDAILIRSPHPLASRSCDICNKRQTWRYFKLCLIEIADLHREAPQQRPAYPRHMRDSGRLELRCQPSIDPAGPHTTCSSVPRVYEVLFHYEDHPGARAGTGRSIIL